MARLYTDWDTNSVLICPPRDNQPQYFEHYTELDMFYSLYATALVSFEGNVSSIYERHQDLYKAQRMLPDDIKHIKSDISDIWLRDYMPLQTDEGFVKFAFLPKYNLSKWNKWIENSTIEFINNYFKVEVKYPDLLLDGGNLVHNGSIGIVTTRALSENKNKTKDEIIKILRDNLFLDKIIFVPPEPYEKTGHIDGILRWANPETIFINKYICIKNEPYNLAILKYCERLNRELDKHLPGINRIDLPFVPSNNAITVTKMKYDRQIWWDAEGLSVNYLQTKNAIYFPYFGLETDDENYAIFHKVFEGKPIIKVPSAALSKFGGVLNCVTWNYVS